jgi:hypothetical protein
MGSWGKLDPLDGREGESGDGEGPANPPRRSWGIPNGLVRDVPIGAQVAAVEVPRSEVDLPPPEATASLLRAGEVLWARADETGLRLGSGQRLRSAEDVSRQPDGWCRVEVTDPETLTVRFLPVATAELRTSVGDDPDLLYQPTSVGEDAEVVRNAPFPVGKGPALREIFDARVANAEAEAERRADERAAEAERRAREHIAAAETQAGNRVAEAERAAETKALTEIDRVQRSAAEQVAAVRASADRAHQIAETLRLHRQFAVGLAGVGWLLVVVLVVLLVVTK